MRVLLLTLILTLWMPFKSIAQELPYGELPEYAETYTAGTVAARMVDALGFRFYWVSEGLTSEDLKFKPNPDARSTRETVDHILDLSSIIVNSTLMQKNSKQDHSNLTYQEKRSLILKNLKMAADILRASDDISQFKIVFGEREFPFWNQINGPIADALWHCGQLAINRRSSGNPINPNVSHFTGTVKE